MAEGFRIDASWLDAIERYVTGLQQDVMDAADAAVDVFRDELVDYAKSKPNWVNLSDSIQTWAEDGRMVVGLQGDDYVSQAEYLEFGDLHNPPDSLFRTAQHVTMLAQERLVSELASRRPIRIPGMA